VAYTKTDMPEFLFLTLIKEPKEELEVDMKLLITVSKI